MPSKRRAVDGMPHDIVFVVKTRIGHIKHVWYYPSTNSFLRLFRLTNRQRAYVCYTLHDSLLSFWTKYFEYYTFRVYLQLSIISQKRHSAIFILVLTKITLSLINFLKRWTSIFSSQLLNTIKQPGNKRIENDHWTWAVIIMFDYAWFPPCISLTKLISLL